MKYRLKNADGLPSKGWLDDCYLSIFPFPITKEVVDGKPEYYIELNTLEDLNTLIGIIEKEDIGHAGGIIMYANQQPEILIYDYYME